MTPLPPTHPLIQWLDATPGGRTRLARGAGIRWQTVDDIVRGKHVPRASTAKAMAAATGGAVSAAAILGVDEHAAHRADDLRAVETAPTSSADAGPR
jgi:hypothetical protein